MFPNEARLRNMTYGTTIYYDMFVEFIQQNEKEEITTDTHEFSKILLGKILLCFILIYAH